MAFLPILNTESENLPKKILVVGDPNRLNVVAKSLQNVEPISENREYRSVRGSFNGQVIGAVSHGVGSAGAGVCFEELCQSGATRIIRAGSAGGMQPNVGAGDLVISTAAVREEGAWLVRSPRYYSNYGSGAKSALELFAPNSKHPPPCACGSSSSSAAAPSSITENPLETDH